MMEPRIAAAHIITASNARMTTCADHTENRPDGSRVYPARAELRRGHPGSILCGDRQQESAAKVLKTEEILIHYMRILHARVEISARSRRSGSLPCQRMRPAWPNVKGLYAENLRRSCACFWMMARFNARSPEMARGACSSRSLQAWPRLSHERLAIYKKPYFLYTFCGPATENRWQAAAVQSTGKGLLILPLPAETDRAGPQTASLTGGPTIFFSGAAHIWPRVFTRNARRRQSRPAICK